MTDKEIDFYDEVKVVDTESPYFGKLGAVLGISEEDGVIYGYAVLLHGEQHNVFVKGKHIVSTGISFTRDDYY
ncbi:Imm31 family immunity protein [Xanthomonas oryzae pv. oryzicola]|uniref:Imm31 family immunity protein n=1 Tax=Xanthomonas oryzae TaxID=347 RepID=UPI0009EAD196|nr:Imm31 family immunity protein [Xanthomonas oryzae]OWB28920.1 hypothetical protein XocBAI21_12385 [Xanthomonas oryzae pv. oryzicola]